jgi:hypothetical protein
MSTPVTRAPARAAGMEIWPAPQATSSISAPAGTEIRSRNSIALGSKVLGEGPVVPGHPGGLEAGLERLHLGGHLWGHRSSFLGGPAPARTSNRRSIPPENGPAYPPNA